jgi:CRISPR-associated protein Csm2
MAEQRIQLHSITPELFDSIAEQWSESVYRSRLGTDCNKRSQLRRFYDELVSWQERVGTAPDASLVKFKRYEPFIRMMKAKVVYAEARKHVSSQFVDMFRNLIDEAKDPESLRNAKLFMEAFMAFYRKYDNS